MYQFRGLPAGSNRADIWIANRRLHIEIVGSAFYSAAATSAGFLLADDIMKSEMRGTISDLKRDPLKTP
jgi:hypothetical protein